MSHVYRVPLRWGDMDAQAHLNNGAYVDYLQEARVDFLTGSSVAGMLGGAGPTGDGGTSPARHGVLVVSHQVEFLRPLVWSPEPLPVRLDVLHVGGAGFTLGYVVGDDPAPVARARTLLAPYDLQGGRVLRLSGDQRTFLKGLLVPAEELPVLPTAPAGKVGSTVPLRVRWSDLDSYGHVNNVRFYDYAQEGRIRLLAGLDEVAGTASRSWLVVRQDVFYRAQLGFRREPYEIVTVVAALGRSSMTLVARVRDPAEGTVFAEIRTVAVCADGEGHPTPIPAELRAALVEGPTTP